MKKSRLIAGAMAVVLGVGGAAEACHRGTARTESGFSGTVTSVGKNSLNLSVHSAKGTKQLVVKFTHRTMVKGTTRSAIGASLVGSSVTVIGAKAGQTINAKEIVISE